MSRGLPGQFDGRAGADLAYCSSSVFVGTEVPGLVVYGTILSKRENFKEPDTYAFDAVVVVVA